jgi:zinc transporter 1/2/3
MLEFGITIHSIFIGVRNGVVGDDELKTLLVALSFHQFFEGVALGSRIVDAEIKSLAHEALMMLVFSISAPLGIAIGARAEEGAPSFSAIS